jgi:hypothetical protein
MFSNIKIINLIVWMTFWYGETPVSGLDLNPEKLSYGSISYKSLRVITNVNNYTYVVITMLKSRESPIFPSPILNFVLLHIIRVVAYLRKFVISKVRNYTRLILVIKAYVLYTY